MGVAYFFYTFAKKVVMPKMRSWKFKGIVERIVSDVIINKKKIVDGLMMNYKIGSTEIVFCNYSQFREKFAFLGPDVGAVCTVTLPNTIAVWLSSYHSKSLLMSLIYHELEHVIDLSENTNYFSSKSDELFDYGDRLKGNKTYNRALSYVLYLFYNCTETNALCADALYNIFMLDTIKEYMIELENTHYDDEVWRTIQPLVSKSKKRLSIETIRRKFLKKTKRKSKKFQRQIKKKGYYAIENGIFLTPRKDDSVYYLRSEDKKGKLNGPYSFVDLSFMNNKEYQQNTVFFDNLEVGEFNKVMPYLNHKFKKC